MSRREFRIRDTGAPSPSNADEVREAPTRKPTRRLVCRKCGTRIETESGYDKCPKCGAPATDLLEERQVRD